MRQSNSLSFLVLFLLLLAGCGNNDTGKQDTANSQANRQNTQDKISKKTKGNDGQTELKQRMGIPFQIRQSDRDTLPLLAIMANLEQNMAVVQAGIWRGNYQAISKAAKAMANHAKIPKREIRKIRKILGKKGLKGFVAADKAWHKKAKELVRVANKKRMNKIVNKTMELFQRCASCHIKYREPLRDSQKWMAR